MTDTIVSMITYVVVCLICAGIAWLLNTEVVNVVAFAALAAAVDTLVRVE